MGIQIQVTEQVSPKNVATVDRPDLSLDGNVFTKQQTKNEIQLAQQFAYLGIANSNTTPPTDGAYWYRVEENNITTFTNLKDANNVSISTVATDFEDNNILYEVRIEVNEGVAKKTKYEKPVYSAKQVYDPLNNIDSGTMMAGKKYFQPQVQELSGTLWDTSINGFNVKKTLTDNTTLTVEIKDGETGYLIVNGNGYDLTIAGKTFETTLKKWIIGVMRLGDDIFAEGKEIAVSVTPPIDPGYLFFAPVGPDIINNSNVITSNKTNNNFGTIGIDSTAVRSANTEGRILFQYKNGDINGILGLTTGTTAVSYTSMNVAFWKNNNGFGKIINGVPSGMVVLTPTVDRYYSLYINASGNVFFQYSDDLDTWTTISVPELEALTITGELRVCCDIASNNYSAGAGRLTNAMYNF